ncbi:hypothetical protein [Neobacillus sp. FSL H8-0543]|uniref:hypothetical protein n=1 Tax=Neobacillus sp. FSL H8-0543 TaxID=2954672 RepID=UPI003159270A
MNVSEKFDQQMLKEILIDIYEKGQENKDINVVDLINEIKSQIKLLMKTPK